MNDTTTTSSHDNSAAQPKPGVFSIVVAIIWVVVNSIFGYLLATTKAHGSDAYANGYVFGYVAGSIVLWQAIVIGLFQIGKRFRNWRSRIRIYNWVSFVIFLSVLAQFGSMRVDEPANRDISEATPATRN